MKLTLNWLKEYVDFDWSPEELAERLTMLGLEVEGVQKLGGEFEGIVVAQVLSKDKHPNADKLTLCRVNDGQGERQIVCGATNFQPGDKVPLILPGATLPAKPGEQPFTIKVGKIRGVESFGMMCSPKELGISDDAQGLLILPPDAKVGQPFAEYLGRPAGDVVYDLEITPNRGDLNSVIGIAREISALTGHPLRLPDCNSAGSAPLANGAALQRFNASTLQPSLSVNDLVAVRIEDPDLCPRYTARIVRGVKVGPSPEWLRRRLEQVGIRSISNVVDVTNYVMMECGQPLHAFDYHLIDKGSSPRGTGAGRSSGAGAPPANVGQAPRLSGPAPGEAPGRLPTGEGACPTTPCPTIPTIVIRRATDGERFTTLDGQERILGGEMLLIADETKAIALAGVMGGLNTEIHDQTQDVLVESAFFKPQNIRLTSKTLGLRTDASYRFERTIDISGCDWASLRCAQLILETAGGQLVPGVVDAYPLRPQPTEITLRHRKIDQLLGVKIPAADNVKYLRALGLEVIDEQPEACRFRIPTFRVDLKRETDLVEEVCRLYGVEKIPATAPRGALGSNAYDAVHDQLAEVRRILTGLGLNEAQGQTLISSAGCGMRSAESVLLANPLSSDMDLLRPSLLPGLLDSLRHNLAHKANDVALFEVGRVFARNNGQTREERRVAIALTGQRQPLFWSGAERDARFDVHDLKGVLEEFLDQFGLKGISYSRRAESTTLFVESAEVLLGGKLRLGELGQLLPTLAKRYDLRDGVLLAELNLDQLLARRNTTRSFRPLPSFPTVRRDVAMLLPETTTHEAVLAAVKQAKPANLESVELFDVFRGKNVPPGQKSVAYAFTYRHAERTLTDTEVNAAHEKLVDAFKTRLQAVIRE